eukprot:368330-Amphidinium_carterae.1
MAVRWHFALSQCRTREQGNRHFGARESCFVFTSLRTSSFTALVSLKVLQCHLEPLYRACCCRASPIEPQQALLERMLALQRVEMQKCRGYARKNQFSCEPLLPERSTNTCCTRVQCNSDPGIRCRTSRSCIARPFF